MKDLYSLEIKLFKIQSSILGLLNVNMNIVLDPMLTDLSAILSKYLARKITSTK